MRWGNLYHDVDKIDKNIETHARGAPSTTIGFISMKSVFLTLATLTLLTIPIVANEDTTISSGKSRTSSQSPSQFLPRATIDDSKLTLTNGIVSAVWQCTPQSLTLASFEDGGARVKIALAMPVFTLQLADGTLIAADKLPASSGAVIVPLAANGSASVTSERLPGKALEVTYNLPAHQLSLTWRAILREGSTYIRQELTMTPDSDHTIIKKLTLIDLTQPNVRTTGSVRGTPIVTDDIFAAIEHPCAEAVIPLSQKTFSWSPSDFPAKRHSVIISQPLTHISAGDCEVEFNYKSGQNRLDISSVRLLVNGKVVSEDTHSGYAGIPKQEPIYRLHIPKIEANEECALEVVVASDGNSNGQIVFRQLNTLMQVRCMYSRAIPLPAKQSFTVSSVIGAYAKGQLRRSFLSYLERERAHPYRPFLHYNSWYHLNIDRPKNRMTESEAVKAIHDIGTELTVKRKVQLQSFIMDDGWDSHEKVWEFNENFPQGFANIARATSQYQAGIGLWMSPFGGYETPKNTRLKFGKQAGFETNANGFSMAGKNYQTHFRDTTLRMIQDFRVNYFKFDGMGGGNASDGSNSDYANDMDAMINVIIKSIRTRAPDTYISATVGTWPSPFWTRYADSIWRQGEDTSFAGVGNGRERWITYRDAAVFERVRSRSILYPLNSLMLHGIVVGDRDRPAHMNKEPVSLKHEARSFFGCGTCLQELYVTPEVMTTAMWDVIAEAAKWAQSRKDTLVDTHWIGGNPASLETYGWAAWSPSHATITIRNPSDKAQNFKLNATEAFELPVDAARSFTVTSPFPDQPAPLDAIAADVAVDITLQPFEVIVLDCVPN